MHYLADIIEVAPIYDHIIDGPYCTVIMKLISITKSMFIMDHICLMEFTIFHLVLLCHTTYHLLLRAKMDMSDMKSGVRISQ